MISHTPRQGLGEMPPTFAAKAIVVPRRSMLLRRTWVRRSLFGLACALGLAGAAGLGFLSRLRDGQQAELVRERYSVAAFARSPEFAAFAADLDRQLVALVNFVTMRPTEAQAALPMVAATEGRQHALPWSMDITPLPVSAWQHPERILGAYRGLNAILARHGFTCDESQRAAARQLYLRTLAPYGSKFLSHSPEYSVPALALDRSLQESALASYAQHLGAGVSIAETERLFAFYNAVGPAMWRAVEQDAKAHTAFAANFAR